MKPTPKKNGRPLKFEPISFKERVDAYFKCKAITRKKFPDLPTKVGLLLWLKMSRENWREYKEKPEFVDTIKHAEDKIEQAWVQYLKRHTQVAGIIFYLKNAFRENYKDKYDSDVVIRQQVPLDKV